MQFYEGQLFRKLSNYVCNDVNGLPSRVMPVASFVVKRLKHPAKNLGPILGPNKNMSHFSLEQLSTGTPSLSTYRPFPPWHSLAVLSAR